MVMIIHNRNASRRVFGAGQPITPTLRGFNSGDSGWHWGYADGDSNVVGKSGGGYTGWGTQLANAGVYADTQRAVSGDALDDVEGRIATQTAADANTRVLYCNSAYNDMIEANAAHGADPDAGLAFIVARIDSLVATAQASNIQVVLTSPLGFKNSIGWSSSANLRAIFELYYSWWYNNQATSGFIGWDLNGLVCSLDYQQIDAAYNDGDDVHLNQAGHDAAYADLLALIDRRKVAGI